MGAVLDRSSHCRSEAAYKKLSNRLKIFLEVSGVLSAVAQAGAMTHCFSRGLQPAWPGRELVEHVEGVPAGLAWTTKDHLACSPAFLCLAPTPLQFRLRSFLDALHARRFAPEVHLISAILQGLLLMLLVFLQARFEKLHASALACSIPKICG